jgi:hypothetical protein
VRVRLTKKFAQMIDDVDLRRFSVGQVISVSSRDGRVLVAEGWAVPNDVRVGVQRCAPSPNTGPTGQRSGRSLPNMVLRYTQRAVPDHT